MAEAQNWNKYFFIHVLLLAPLFRSTFFSLAHVLPAVPTSLQFYLHLPHFISFIRLLHSPPQIDIYEPMVLLAVAVIEFSQLWGARTLIMENNHLKSRNLEHKSRNCVSSALIALSCILNFHEIYLFFHTECILKDL